MIFFLLSNCQFPPKLTTAICSVFTAFWGIKTVSLIFPTDSKNKVETPFTITTETRLNVPLRSSRCWDEAAALRSQNAFTVTKIKSLEKKLAIRVCLRWNMLTFFSPHLRYGWVTSSATTATLAPRFAWQTSNQCLPCRTSDNSSLCTGFCLWVSCCRLWPLKDGKITLALTREKVFLLTSFFEQQGKTARVKGARLFFRTLQPHRSLNALTLKRVAKMRWIGHRSLDELTFRSLLFCEVFLTWCEGEMQLLIFLSSLKPRLVNPTIFAFVEWDVKNVGSLAHLYAELVAETFSGNPQI